MEEAAVQNERLEEDKTGEEGTESDEWSGEMEEDDEDTIRDEEENPATEDDADEISALHQEQNIPLQDLIKLYGYSAGRAAETSPVEDERASPNLAQTESSAGAQNRLPDSSGDEMGVLGSKEDGGEHGYFSEGSSSDDEDYLPPEVWKKEIRVGPEYQADVPLTASELEEGVSEDFLDVEEVDWEEIDQESENGLLWRPLVSRKNQDLVEKYLRNVYRVLLEEKEVRQEENGVSSSSDPLKPLQENLYYPEPTIPILKRKPVSVPVTNQTLRDDEEALLMLLKCHFDGVPAQRRVCQLARVPGALESKMAQGASPDLRLALLEEVEMSGEQLETLRPSWTQLECEQFEEGLRLFGKNFHQIQTMLPGRTVRELVHFYYAWKKTERHDMFVQRVRFEKKKYTLPPFSTDYMEHFLDQIEGETADVAFPARGSALLISSDPKHGVGCFHGTHFNEWAEARPPLAEEAVSSSVIAACLPQLEPEAVQEFLDS